MKRIGVIVKTHEDYLNFVKKREHWRSAGVEFVELLFSELKDGVDIAYMVIEESQDKTYWLDRLSKDDAKTKEV